MDDLDLRLCLLDGDDIEIEGVGLLYSLKLREIKKIRYSKYNAYLSVLVLDRNEQEIDDSIEATNFEITLAYCQHDNNFKNVYLDALKCFFKEDIRIENGYIYVGDNGVICNENYDEIQKMIRLQNWLKQVEKEDYNPGNDEAKRFIEELKRIRKNAPASKSNLDLHSLISGVAWKSNSVNLFNVYDLTIYQFYDAYHRLENIDNYEYTLRGVYTGTVDSKKINFKDLNWAKILNN